MFGCTYYYCIIFYPLPSPPPCFLSLFPLFTMTAPFLSFLYFPSTHSNNPPPTTNTTHHPIDDDDDDYSSISSDEGHWQSSPTIYVAIITRRDGSVKTKYLNPSAVSHHYSNMRTLRGRKRAFSASSLFTKKSTLQKKAKHLLLWSKHEEDHQQGVSTSLAGMLTREFPMLFVI